MPSQRSYRRDLGRRLGWYMVSTLSTGSTSANTLPIDDFIDVELDINGTAPDIFTHLESIATLKGTKNVQPLTIGSESWHAAYIGAYYTIKTPPRGQPPSLEEHREIDPRSGQAKDLGIVLRFRTTPGAA